MTPENTTEVRRPGLVARTGMLVAKHRRAAMIGWLVIVIAALGASTAVGSKYSNSFSLPGTQSQRATDLLQRDFAAQSGDSDQVVFSTRTGTVYSPAVRATVASLLARITALPHVAGVISPYSPGSQAISRDHTVAFATVNFDERANVLPVAAIKHVISVAEAARSATLQVELGGAAIEQTSKPALGIATLVGLVAAMVVLLITFGSLLAMGLPILSALLGLGTAVGLAGLGTRVVGVPDFATELAAMIGLGVGIDYALFIITRFRENYRAGLERREAIVTAMDTSGRAVLFAGLTVIVALLGQFALGVSFINGLALASALAVLMVMLAALTILPVGLSRFGDRIARPGRLARVRLTRAGADRPGLWERWALMIQRHPWQAAIGGVSVMLVLAIPSLSMRLGTSDAGNNPASDTTRQAYDLLAKGFGAGVNGPLLIVAQLPHTNDAAALTRISTSLRASRDVASVTPARLSPAGRTATFDVYPRSAPEAAASTTLVKRLRSVTLPPVARATDTTLLVGGQEATTVDFTRVLSSKLALFIGLVVALSALLLLVVFRSLVIPLQAALMNLLSIGAALGISVAVFQYGWLGSFFNVKAGPIDAFIPVMLFSIVFGLSIDYEVFLVLRVHEEWTRRRDASAAVTRGLASTGRVITAAAAIMIFVFASFAVGDERVLKLFGLSLASAVFLDAFVVRCMLLPAVLELLGRRTWVLPSWLERRLPHVAIEPEEPIRAVRQPASRSEAAPGAV